MDANSAQQNVATLFPRAVVLRSGLQARQAVVGGYLLDFIAGGPVIAISFETAGQKINRSDGLRDGWGVSFLSRLGYSVLAVKAKQRDWYRKPELHEWFRMSAPPFFAGFEDRVFIGGSMGGFAAITFSRVAPGSLVIAHNPQSTLNPKLVPWERRFEEGRRQNWGGDFGDAAEAAPLARKIYVTFDPMHISDRLHVERLGEGNIVSLKMPFMGHETPEWLKQLGVLRQSTEAALAETLTSAQFAQMVRHRRTLPRYHKNALQRVKYRKHQDALLFDGARRFDTDTMFFEKAVVRYFELHNYRRCTELYFGRLTLSKTLPPVTQGILRGIAGIATVRRMPKKGESGRKKLRLETIAKLASQLDSNSKNLRELLLSGRFLGEAGNLDRAELFARAALKLAPDRPEPAKLLVEIEKRRPPPVPVVTKSERVKSLFSRLW